MPGRDIQEEQGEDPRLAERLWYLSMLMRRGDSSPRGSGRRGGSFHGQGRVLRLLALQSPTTQKELAYLAGIRPQSLAEQLSRLEDAGLIARQPNPDDRRTSVVQLTDEGREAAEMQEKARQTDPFAVLSDDEKQQFAQLLDRVTENAESALPGGPDRRLRAFKDRAFGNEQEPELGEHHSGHEGPGGHCHGECGSRGRRRHRGGHGGR